MNNIQLTCGSCGQSYQIQAGYQNVPHQCPICGVMQGQQQPMQQQPMQQQPMQQQPMQQQPMQQQPMQQQPMQQQPMQPMQQQPMQPMQPAGAQPMYQQAPGMMPGGYAAPASSSGSKKVNTVFIIRCVVGVVALVTIVVTLIYVFNRGYNITVDLGDTSKFGTGGSINAGDYEVSPGKTFKATLKIKADSGQDLYFTMRHTSDGNAKISEEGVFTWEVPDDLDPGTYRFNFILKDRNDSDTYEIVKISFDIT